MVTISVTERVNELLYAAHQTGESVSDTIARVLTVRNENGSVIACTGNSAGRFDLLIMDILRKAGGKAKCKDIYKAMEAYLRKTGQLTAQDLELIKHGPRKNGSKKVYTDVRWWNRARFDSCGLRERGVLKTGSKGTWELA